MVTYKEVVDNCLISDETLDYIPRYCDCGAEIAFSDTLKQIFCPDRFCYLKVAARLENMAKAMGVDGFGESTCQNICRDFKMRSPFQIFLIKQLLEEKNAAYSGVSAFDKKLNDIYDMSKRRVKLWEMVKLAGMPDIETIAYKIFDGYKTIEEAYKDIENGQVAFVANRLGISNGESSVMAVNIYNTLINYKTELEFGESVFDIYETEGEKLNIVITGGVYGFRNKSEFVKYLNSKFFGKLNAVLGNSVTSTTDVLIADGDTSSAKYRNAVKLQNNGNDIMIMESGELVQYLEERYS